MARQNLQLAKNKENKGKWIGHTLRKDTQTLPVMPSTGSPRVADDVADQPTPGDHGLGQGVGCYQDAMDRSKDAAKDGARWREVVKALCF